MSALVSIGSISIAAASNCVGIFSGQNVQCNWDSHAPNISTMGGTMGNFSWKSTGIAALSNQMQYGQPVFDADTKNNLSPQWIGL